MTYIYGKTGIKHSTMARIEIYTTPTCGFCFAAKALLERKNASYDEVSVVEPDKRQAMTQRAHGRLTVPQVFIDDTHVGGFDDLSALDRSGELDRMLADREQG